MCSHIDAKKGGFQPFTALEWSKLVIKIIGTDLKEPSTLLRLSKEEIEEQLQIDSGEAERILKLLSRGANMAFILEDLERKGIKVVTRSDGNYPSRLKSLLKKQAPPLFYYAGNLDLLNYKSIAIVGSRNIDKEDENFAYSLAKKASDERIVVVSGGAKGVDSISEEAALQNNGVAVSVIADSLTRKIKKKSIRDAVIEGRLLVMSAINPDAPFSAGSAMSRNKYVYALSMSAFIIASDFNKGGTWSGAVENLKNDWVKSFVLESDKHNGNIELIRKGVRPISDLNDFTLVDLINSEKDIYKQVNVFEVSSEIQEENGAYSQKIAGKVEESDSTSPFDLYYSFIDKLEGLLSNPRSLEDIMGYYKTNKSQTVIWLNRALDEELITKMVKPVRYMFNK
ncbi:DNA-processing protein DprA [Vallitalea sediminicola]